MKSPELYEKAYIKDSYFPIQVSYKHYAHLGNIFNSHWHEALEILYFTKGYASIECAGNTFTVKPGDIVIINSNELHSGQNIGEDISYYCIDMGTSLLQSGGMDLCEVKYIEPISKNIIMFKNKMSGNIEAEKFIETIIYEFETKMPGYELSVKGSVYNLITILLRSHIRNILTPKECDIRQKNFDKLKNALIYIENNFANQLNLDILADECGFSLYHFCHEFKKVTGKSPGEYITGYRMAKAETLLVNSDMNITEIALATGFNDSNYFSRMFKKYKKDSPSAYRKKNLNKSIV